jgi:hypothetical protein
MDHHQLIVYHSHGPQTQVANLILLVHICASLLRTSAILHSSA